MTLPGLDHVVHCVRDLEGARERYASIGFTLTPPAEHPFGTGNSLAQMGRSFIELLAVVAPAKIPPHADGRLSFGAWNRDFLARGEGMSMLVLSSDDARADEARWRARGLHTFEPFDFERMARQPDGSEARVAFTIAFAVDDALPGLAFFCCQQHAPENFWQRAYQAHANGAENLASVTLVAPAPGRHAAFFSALVGDGAVTTTSAGLRVGTGLGVIEIVTPGSLAGRFAGIEGVPTGDAPRFAGCAVSVADLDAARAFLDEAGVPYVRGADRLGIGPNRTGGLVLELV